MTTIITKTKLSADEREVLINLSYGDDGKLYAEIDTSIQKYATKCIKQGWEQISETRHTDGSWVAATFRAPAKAISIGKAERTKRVLTDEQRQAASERMKAAREARQDKNGDSGTT